MSRVKGFSGEVANNNSDDVKSNLNFNLRINKIRLAPQGVDGLASC